MVRKVKGGKSARGPEGRTGAKKSAKPVAAKPAARPSSAPTKAASPKPAAAAPAAGRAALAPPAPKPALLVPAAKPGSAVPAAKPASAAPAAKPASAVPVSKPALVAPAPSAPVAAPKSIPPEPPKPAPLLSRARPVSVPPPAPPIDDGRTSVTIETAKAIVETADAAAITEHASDLLAGKPTALATAARVLEEVLTRKPEMLVPQIERLVAVISSPHRRAVQTAAMALPVMARLAPARVARHLPVLTERFGTTTDVAKDGLVATFAALCTASVAYQKRLEPVLELALSTADPLVLLRWAETILPSLKGEPHARARAVVENRLPVIPRAQAQPIATFLGIKLRPPVAAAR